jgi:transcriptional regulator GlxA family with amidase domain
MIRIAIVLFEGFEELDAIGPWDVLRSAQAAGAPFEVSLVWLGDATTVEAAKGLRVAVEPNAATRAFDWVIVPGGGWASRPARGAWAEVQRGALPEALRRWRAGGAAIASVCTGAMILSAAGLTRGRPATTHAVARQALRAEGAEVIDARVVDDGDLVTAAGVTSGIDLALWLTERLASRAIADGVATNMEHQRQGAVHRARPGTLTS